MNGKMIFAGLVAVLMVACTVPFFASEETDALTGHGTHMSLNTDRASIFCSNGQNSAQFTATVDVYPANTNSSDIAWKLNDLDDGPCVSFSSANNNTVTASGPTVTVYAVSPGSVELEAYIPDHDEDNTGGCYASAVIYVRNSPGTHATEFNFFFQIYNTDDEDLDASLYYDDIENYLSDNLALPSGYVYENGPDAPTTNNFAVGFWMNVTYAEMHAADSTFTLDQFNALTALQYLLDVEGSNDWGLSTPYGNGWIDSFLGLNYIDPMDGTYIYWAQYHAVGDHWEFNNAVLDYLDTEECCDIGLIFCASLSASYTPPFPATEP
ncbi:MAG: hypothetical protein J5897_02990 [Candidatus Methanomethylophilus sp.]|nr:hypothetical protein [Methanomethylophilus sp.]MBO5599990.1 hypothetical protein [Methanomethylophilus sp.]